MCPMSCALPSHANTHVRKHTCTHTHGVLQSRGSILPSLEECRRGRGHRVPPLPCHLLATCGWLLEAAQAGKGSERGSSLLYLAQERSQQLQSHCEVMPGAACVFLQVETDSGRVGWQPQPRRAHRENNTTTGCWAPALPHQVLGAWGQVGILAAVCPKLPSFLGRGVH